MKQYQLKSGNILEVDTDNDAESPNDWGDEEIFLVYTHRQFNIRRDGFLPQDIYDCMNCNSDEYSKDYYIFPVEAYMHSGISIAIFNRIKQCQWDSSVTGFILIKKGSIDVELQTDTYSELIGLSELDVYTHYANGLIKTWNQYLSGNVYWYRLFKLINIPRKLTNLILEQFDKTRHLTLLARDFADSMIYDILNKNTDIIEEEILDSCGGYYADSEEEFVKEILQELNEELV